MTFRPWVILALGIAATMVLAVLIYQEDMPSAAVEEEVVKVREPLRTLSYLPSSRRQNLVEVMGFSTQMAENTARSMERLQTDEKRWLTVLKKDPAGLGGALCAGGELPQPYAMLRYLVYQEGNVRRVVEPGTIIELEAHPWYEQSVVPALYNKFEANPRMQRKTNATQMAVAAAILGLEGPALDGESPWATSGLGSWSYPDLESAHPRVRLQLMNYFALMHYLTELANRPGGICS